MTLKNHEAFTQIQQKYAVSALSELARSCRRRFLRAANLLEVPGDAIKELREFGVLKGVNVAPLMRAWLCLCERYVRECYDPQLSLLHSPETYLEEQWSQFVYWRIWPVLVNEDGVVRNVLRALGGLPCRSPKEAAAAVRQHILEMPLSTQPTWEVREAVEEMVDEV